MLRKIFSLGALIVVALTFAVGSAAAKPNKPPKGANNAQTDGFSDGRLMNSGSLDGFSDGRD